MIDGIASQRFFEIVQRRFQEAVLLAPTSRETEFQYTKRVLQPIAQRLVDSLETPGLVCGGDGGGPTHRSTLLGMAFVPDIEFSYRGQRLVAVEVKFVGATRRQQNIASAMGQALIYRLGGFQFCIALILDMLTNSYRFAAADALVNSTGHFGIIVKRRNHLGQLVTEQELSRPSGTARSDD